MLNKIKSSIFFKNFSIYFIGLLVSGLISFITIPIITQKYTVAVYGEFSLIQNVILLLIAFGGGWINQCVIRFNNHSINFKIGIYQLFLLIFAPLIIISFFIVYFFSSNLIVTLLGLSSLFLGGFSALLVVFYQSNFSANQTLIVNLIRSSVFAGSLLLFVFFKDKINNMVILTFCLFLSFFLSILPIINKETFFIKKSFQLLNKKLNKDYIARLFLDNKKYFNYGWPLAFWFTISSILNVSDRYIINLFTDTEKVGVYSSIYDILSKSITMICSPILIAGFPIMTRKYNEGRSKEAYKMLFYLVFFELSLMIITLIFAFFMEDFFLENVLGIENTDVNKSLIIPIIVGIYLWQFAMLAHKPLELLNKTKLMLLAIIMSVSLNVILNFLCIPVFGFTFAAYCTAISASLYLIIVTLMSYFNKY